jgi:hypothetical protein
MTKLDFGDQGTPKLFFSPFFYQSGPKLLIYAKIIIKKSFSAHCVNTIL